MINLTIEIWKALKVGTHYKYYIFKSRFAGDYKFSRKSLL